MNVYKIKIESISCSNCAKTITNALTKEFKDIKVRVSVVNKMVYVSTKYSISEVMEVLIKNGYPPVDNNKKESKLKKYDLVISIVLALILLISMFVHIYQIKALSIFTNVVVILSSASILQFYIGMRYYKAAYVGIKNKVLGMDFLVVFSTTLTYFYSLYLLIVYSGEKMLYFEASGLIITIVLIGKKIEDLVKANTNELIDKLTNLTSDEITLVTGEIVDANFVDIGEVYIVNPGEKIPLDGVLLTSVTSIDESMLTGESVAVVKHALDEVYAGCINLGAQLEIKTNKLKEDNYINQIIESVEEASLIDTKYTRVADRVASIFVPIILLIALLTFIITYLLTNDFVISFEHATAVIVISCPCALGLATPTSIMVSNSISAELGILYKGSKFFELAEQLDILAFDKTATLTHGNLIVEQLSLSDEYQEYVYAAQSQINHPASKALVNYLDISHTNLKPHVNQVPGIGIIADFNHDRLSIGNKELLSNQDDINMITKLEKKALSVSVILYNDKFVGYYTMRDQIKDESSNVINTLKELSITPLLISGDNKDVVSDVANKLDIDDYYYKVSPNDKMNILKKYKTDDNIIGFVGDGINDSISLKYADIGFSVATSSDIAKAASDVTLLHDDLSLVIEAIKLSKKTKQNIKYNFMWAFSYNIVAIPLAAFGMLNMVWAAIFMGFSSIIVVVNALLFKRRYKRKYMI